MLGGIFQSRLAVEFEQRAFGLALDQPLVFERIEKSDNVKDFGDFLFEVENIQLQSRRPHLQDIGDFGDFARSHRHGVANLLPDIDGINRIQLEQITPLAPGRRRDSTLVL
ncbi:MAG TPA: hypothetical protein EYQ18_13310 [Candidatus Handelsmanbacteria bacterium]|nr:hypothetical protein [Candidatus Handelsmanbacteria bacterium]